MVLNKSVVKGMDFPRMVDNAELRTPKKRASRLVRVFAWVEYKYDRWSRKIEIRWPIRVRSTLEVYQMIAADEWSRNTAPETSRYKAFLGTYQEPARP